jgi:hypothetical protein
MSKISSRKLWVFIVWAIFTLTSVIITGNINPDVVAWFGSISVIYIGGNVAQKLFTPGPRKESLNEPE